MNAANQVQSVDIAKTLASIGTLVRNYFPAAALNLSPWRDDPQTRFWVGEETLDLAFHFPGWTPKLQCRSFLIQLKVSKDANSSLPQLLGILIRGMTFDGERWRLATIGDWEPRGSHLPNSLEVKQLQSICRGVFELFPSYSI